ncbi:hypothetical protein [Chromobacterium amazonense]|uniref:hypothetical protein n=1 Tax=Chromobacterium amazonense TaxID=1382803 RepID=UPI003F7B1C67
MKRFSRTRQQGQATVWILAALALAVMAFLSGEVDRIVEAKRQARPALQAKYLQDSGAAIAHWYQRDLATLDADGAPALTEADVLAGAGLTPRYGLRLAISQPIRQGNLRWHSIALWLPPEANDATTFDPATGRLTPDPRALSYVVSGQAFQQAAWQRTTEAVANLVSALNAYAQQRSRSLGGDVTRNPFRALNCGQVEAGELPCLDDYVPAPTIAAALGLNPGQLVDAWNQPLLVSGGTDANRTAAPYSMAVKATTPWGASLVSVALQSLH